MVEGVVGDGSTPLIGVNATEVVPESKTDLWQEHTALATSII